MYIIHYTALNQELQFNAINIKVLNSYTFGTGYIILFFI